MTTEAITAEHWKDRNTTIEVAGTDLIFRSLRLGTETPTGGAIAKAAGFSEDHHAYVMQWREDGDLEEIRTHEEAKLNHGRRFIVAAASAANRITIDGNVRDWPADVISGRVVRKLGNIPPEKAIFLVREDEPDREIQDADVIAIKREGVEEFKGRKLVWELRVQGVLVTSDIAEISAADALAKAGFEDPNAWIIMLKEKGGDTRQLTPGDIVDLRPRGIEKIRLVPKEVNNGEAPPAPRRDFSLLDGDQRHLDALGLFWETVLEGEMRWLILHGFALPRGYQTSTTALALLIPPIYPQAEIDMFFVHPALVKVGGGTIPATEARQVIGTLQFQRWSRHRGQASQWNPRHDNVVTHLALVDAALAKEVWQ